MSLPATDNVFGEFCCSGSLEKLAEVLRAHLDLRAEQVWVKRSNATNEQTIRLQHSTADFESERIDAKDTYLFNGRVKGSREDVLAYVERLYTVLSINGFSPEFEIYQDGSYLHSFGNV